MHIKRFNTFFFFMGEIPFGCNSTSTKNKSDNYFKSLEIAFNLVFSVHNKHLNLCMQVDISQWLMCGGKTGFR